MLAVTKLERHWEERLRREGMPAEPRRLTRVAPGPAGDRRGSIVSLAVIREVAAESLQDAPVARHWANFSQAAHDLPKSWGRRKTFLIALGDHGEVSAACRETKTHPYHALVWQRQFQAWRTVNGC